MIGAVTNDVWSRARIFAQAGREYVRLVADAWRAWLYCAIAAGAVMGLSVLVGLAIPLWAVAAIPVLTLVGVQFHAFYRVRQQREAFQRANAMQAHLDEIAALRSKESELKSRAIRDHGGYVQWKAELVALRSEIHRKIERGISRAEAETFHTVGNLRHEAAGGPGDEYNLLLAVAARDLDHLAELIHGYARFGRD
jgi:hypothetical protein